MPNPLHPRKAVSPPAPPVSARRRPVVALLAALALILVAGGLGGCAGRSAASTESEPILSYPDVTPAPTVGSPPAALAGASLGAADILATWAVVDTPAGIPGEGGRWVLVDGQVAQDGMGAAGQSSSSETALLSPAAIGDGGISAAFYDEYVGTVGLVARHSDAGFYRLRIHTYPTYDGEALVLEKVVGEVITPLAVRDGEPLYRRHGWHTLGLSVEGGALTATLDGEVVASASDGSLLPAGSAGLYARALGGIRFAQIALSGEED